MPVSLASDSYSINYILNISYPSITQYWNSINGYNQTMLSLNAGNSVAFNVTVDQTITNVSWKVEGIEEQNISNLQFSRSFNSIGTFNVTAQAFNANGSSNIIYTVVTVTSSGGGGTNWDWAYGWVKYPNGTTIPSVTITTSVGNAYTDGNGYYFFGYVFIHGNTYNFNFTKTGHNYSSQDIIFTSGDYEIVNATLNESSGGSPPIVNGTSIITSWSNDYTNNNSLSFSVVQNTVIAFNATSNQSITTWTWGTATKLSGDGTTGTTANHNFTTTGDKTVTVSGINSNGSTQTITWNIHVSSAGGNSSLSGYVDNPLGLKIQNARIDFNSGFTFTDTNGYYLFSNTPNGTQSILARSIGYQNQTKSTNISGDTMLNFTLSEQVASSSSIVSTPGFEGIIGLLALFSIVILRKKT